MRKKMLFLILVVFILTSICYARMISWNKTEEPPVKLEEALKIAKEELQKMKK